MIDQTAESGTIDCPESQNKTAKIGSTVVSDVKVGAPKRNRKHRKYTTDASIATSSSSLGSSAGLVPGAARATVIVDSQRSRIPFSTSARTTTAASPPSVGPPVESMHNAIQKLLQYFNEDFAGATYAALWYFAHSLLTIVQQMAQECPSLPPSRLRSIAYWT